MPNFISEDNIEQAVLTKLHEQHGFQLLNCYTADADNLNDRSNRTNKRDVIFVDQLKTAALRLNPSLPEIAIDKALTIFTANRSIMSSIAANRELDGLIRSGISTDYENSQGRTETVRVNIIDFNNSSNTDVVQPKNSKEMRETLTKNKPIIFTLIQKFRYDKGKQYPVLSDRNDIIVIVDEAHRTQYKTLAENMRAGLPNANYLAFTGTPLLGTDRKTNAWFGGYVSEYNFSQSIDDGATVPLFYQKRVPEVLIQNEDLSAEFYQILEDEDLDEAQQAKLEKKFATELEVIKRDDRLETIAKDIVYHFPRRGYLGKGLVVSVDKFTAVKMYEKVQHHWKAEIKNLVGSIKNSHNDIEKAQLKKILDFMRATDMGVVISLENSDAEIDRFAKQGLDLKPHRDRLQTVDSWKISLTKCCNKIPPVLTLPEGCKKSSIATTLAGHLLKITM